MRLQKKADALGKLIFELCNGKARSNTRLLCITVSTNVNTRTGPANIT